MPGARPRNLRKGDISERFAEFVLGAFAFTTPVPRQEDVGHDFYCALIDPDIPGPNLVAGPSFVVQAKSRKDPVTYETDSAIEWISSQENPLFICYVDLVDLQVELYSTWTLLEGVLHYGPTATVLEPDKNVARENIVTDTDGVLHIPLGDPVLRIKVDDAVDPELSAKYGRILREWIRMDRQNIVNRWGKVHWIQGPETHSTNELLSEDSQFRVSFYWNPKNLESSLRNLTKAVTHLRLEVERLGEISAQTINDQKVEALDGLLTALWAELGPSARLAIMRHVDGHWPADSQSSGDLLTDFFAPNDRGFAT